MNRGLLTLLTLGGIAAAYWVTFGFHHQRQIDALNLEIEAAYAAFERANAESAQAATLQASVDTLGRWQRELSTRMHFDPVADPALLELKARFEGGGITVEKAETLPGDLSLQLPHQRMRFLVGGTFGNLFQALHRLENSTLPTRVTELSVSTANEPGRVRAEMTVVRVGSVE